MSTNTSDPKATLVGVTEPEKLGDIIRTRVSELRAKSLYAERLQSPLPTASASAALL